MNYLHYLKNSFYISLLFLLFNCNDADFEKKRIFKNYIDKDMRMKLGEKDTYLFIPINSCSPCVDKFLTLLKSGTVKRSLTIVLIGNSHKELKYFKHKIQGNFDNEILIDIEDKAFLLGIVSNKPLLVYNKSSIQFLEFSSAESFNKIKNIISQ